MSDAKRQKTGKTLALFDVDGTLTIPRKVRARVRSGLREPTPRVLLLSPPLRVASAFAPD
jgi:hypothetical protein